MIGARAALAAALTLLAASAAAQSRPPIPCGDVYVIQRGDTLHRVAVRAYGADATYRHLWDVNRAHLGTRNPSLIEVGTEIFVPCLDAAGAPILDGAPWLEPVEAAAPGGPEADADAGAPGASAAVAAAPPPADDEADPRETPAQARPDPAAPAPPDGATSPAPGAAAVAEAPPADDAADEAAATVAPPADGPATAPVAAVDAPPSGGGVDSAAAPSVDATQAEPATAAGASPVADAAAVAPPADDRASAPVPAPPVVVTVGDNGLAASVARAALVDRLGDAAPAVTPARPEGAPAVLLALASPACATTGGCDDALWSAPLIDDAMVFHARPGADAAAALRGGAVCASGPEIAQAARAAVGPQATVTTAPDAAACLAAVAAGAADVAVSTATAADAAGDRPGVEEALALTRPVSLRATAPRDDPQAAAILRALDEGLAALRASGGWFDTVQRHFDKGL